MSTMKRRNFVKIATPAAASFMIVPRHVLGGKGYVSPSDKLNIAGIGIGGKGSGDLKNVENENIVALCDVDDRYAAPVFSRYPQAKKYRDYRTMLFEQKDIDAVMIATPDHTHAIIAMAAMNAGKHVFCQKPLAHDIHETLTLRETASKLGLITQMGIQGHAMEGIRLICEWIWGGVIGEVSKVEAWCSLTHYPPGHQSWSTPCADRPNITPPTPGSLDWDLWLGPAKHRPYSPCYHPRVWRNWWDFGSGMMADRGAHTLDPIVTALKLKSPKSVEAISTDYNEETYPVASIVNYRFDKRKDFPELELTWYEGLRPPKPKELEIDRQLGHKEGGVLFIGSKGKIMCGVYGESPRIIPESKMKSSKLPPKTIPRSPGIFNEWIDGIKNKNQPSANFDYSGPLTDIVILGNMAKRFNGQVLEWDGIQNKVTNNPETNKYLHKEYREGWSL
jgi:predicted dehydrogenase